MDSLSHYDGIPFNSSTYYTPGINGYGSALSIDPSFGQYVNVPKHQNLSSTSFTTEMWFYPTNLISGDYGLLDEDYGWHTDQQLHCVIRNNRMHFGFYYDDLDGSTVIQNNQWYHVAFVFDYFSLTKKIYLNGILDASGDSSCYKGLNGSISIGIIDYRFGNPSYFSG